MHNDHDHLHYLITAIASDGVVVDHNEVCEDDLEYVTVSGMPKGSYITCLPIPTSLN